MESLQKGKELFEKQNYKEAIVLLNDFLASNINNADALYIRAICYRKISDFNSSIDDLTNILKRLPNEASLLSERGVSHFHNKNIEAALKDMDKAVEIEPDNSYRYSSRAYIRANIDVEGAIEDYKKAIDLDPNDAIALNNLGLLEENMGKLSSAKNRFNASNKIIGYDPKKRQEKTDNKNEITPHEKTESVGKIMLNVFTSKKTRKEYFAFLKSKFKN